MKLFILRHGQAEARAASDAERALTARGRRDVKKITDGSASELLELEQIWVSPLRRAQETAAVAMETLDWGSEPITTALLEPGSDVEALCEQLRESDYECLLLISHQPLVGALIEHLSGAAPGRYAMGTASLACLEFDWAASGLAEVKWLRHSDG